MSRLKIATGVFLILLFLTSVGVVFAQSEEAIKRNEARLMAELQAVEKEIAAQNELLKGKQKESASLQRDLSVLNYQITTAKLNVKAKQIEIERLGHDIVKKQDTIGNLNYSMERERQSLGELLRKNRTYDDTSVVEVALAGDKFSDFFADVNSFQYLQRSLHRSFNAIVTDKKETERQKVALVGQRDATLDAKAAIEKESKKVEVLEKEKKDLLAVTKNQESNYKKVIADRKKRRTEILSALFQLRDTKGIEFGLALDLATKASQRTGVRPAFILAILTQESNLGKNVGTCNRPQDKVKWQQAMKPGRDDGPFLRITKSLGLDPTSMPVSCPSAGGYGGAMGPSQFIPSTWEMYIKRIAAVTGNNPPNPWKPEDAIAATSLLLKDLGAAGGGYTAERRAALKYYAGGNWEKPQNAFYGNQVMVHATNLQKNIDYLQESQ